MWLWGMWLSGDGRDDLIIGLDDLKRSNSMILWNSAQLWIAPKKEAMLEQEQMAKGGNEVTRQWELRGKTEYLGKAKIQKAAERNIFVSAAFGVCRPTDRRYYCSHFIKQSACGNKWFSFKCLDHWTCKGKYGSVWADPHRKRTAIFFWLEFLHYRVTIVIKSFCFRDCHKDKLTKDVKLLFPN